MLPFRDHLRQIATRRSSKYRRCSHPKIDNRIITYEPKGDMLLLVGKQKCIIKSCNELPENKRQYDNAICFRVDSTLLAGSSPAFGFALYSPFAEVSDGHMRWDVHLPDDDPRAMQIIINILYNIFPKVQDIDIEPLHNLAVLVDKYDLVHLLMDWTPRWVQNMESYWVGRRFIKATTEDLESLLWIFWVLGHEPLYTLMILELAFYSELDASGILTDPSGQMCFTNTIREVTVPPCAPMEIGHARISILKATRKEIKKTLEEHLNGNKNKCTQCKRGNGSKDRGWRLSVLKWFTEMLEAEGIWPVPLAHHCTASPKSLVEMFRFHPNLPAFTHDQQHTDCHPDGPFWARIDTILYTIRYYLPTTVANHLRQQAVKSGLARFFQSMGLRADRGDWTAVEILRFHEFVANNSYFPPTISQRYS